MKLWWWMVILLPLAGCAVHGSSTQMDMREAAADYCVSAGGETEIRENRLGTGRYCRLPDGRVENEWQFYRDEHLDNR